jgi:hypothetical protein
VATRSWWSQVVLLFLALAVVFIGFREWRLETDARKLQSDLEEARWDAQIAEHERTTKRGTLSVGVIQMLDGGYSLTLDSIGYGADGVTLVGKLGNRNAFNLSSLTLNLQVCRNFYMRRDEYLHGNPFDFMLGDSSTIGKAQVAIGDLFSGTEAPFRVTVPNVRQNGEEYELEVAFTGERYGYLR